MKQYQARHMMLLNSLEHINDSVYFYPPLVPLRHNEASLLLRGLTMNRDWTAIFKRERSFAWRFTPTHFTEYTAREL